MKKLGKASFGAIRRDMGRSDYDVGCNDKCSLSMFNELSVG